VVVPREAQVATLIEFAHRLTSGLSGLLVLVLLVWVFRRFARGHIARWGAAVSTFFILTEGLIGAGLVLFELVSDNASQARAVAITAHLVNTFFLLASLALTAWWIGGGRPIRWRNQGTDGWLLLVGLLALLLVGASGAITALGDTLFPSGSLSAGIAQDFLPTAHFLIRLRLWHPLLAVSSGLYLLVVVLVVNGRRPNPQTTRFRRAVQLLVLTQLVAGAVNVLLLAPVWMQLLHLLLADLLWIALILFTATALGQEAASMERVLRVEPIGD
jgi:heme A synthase